MSSNFYNNHDIIIKNKTATIRINNKKVYDGPFELTLSDLHKQLLTTGYEEEYSSLGGKNNVNEDVENKYVLPPIVWGYYFLLVWKGVIPTCKELCDYYIDTFFNVINNEKISLKNEYKERVSESVVLSADAVRARVCRAYNSFNREVDLMLKFNSIKDISAEYSFKDDTLNGIDITVIYNNKKYNVATYWGSNRSNEFKMKKDSYRHKENAETLINAIIKTDDSFYMKNYTERIGDTLLYNNRAVDNIVKEIMSK